MLVALTLLSVLTAVALPYAEVTIRRNHEIELRQSLREIRTAIDTFHNDWLAGRISQFSDAASEDGYPVTLGILMDGIDMGGIDGRKRYYLRRIPRDPFGASDRPHEEQWKLRSYQDKPHSGIWGGRDVYDVNSFSREQALDGSYYADW